MNIIRLMIVDDHHMVRTSLAMSLNVFADIDIVAEASNGVEAIEFQTKLQPDVILMDLIMPEMSGIEAIRLISDSAPNTRIIALSSFKDNDLVRDALEAGAMSYILKNASIENLLRAIRDAMQGKATLAQEATEALIASTRQPRVNAEQFSEREIEVLRHMVEGRTNGQIASELDLSLSTIKFHVGNILSKLHAESRTEAVSRALQHNLLK